MTELVRCGSTLSVAEDGNERRRNCRKAAGNPRSPGSAASSPGCDNVWLTRGEHKEREGKRGGLRGGQCIKKRWDQECFRVYKWLTE